MQIELTAEEAAILRNVFLPRNPNKMRNATEEVKETARKLIRELEKEGGR